MSEEVMNLHSKVNTQEPLAKSPLTIVRLNLRSLSFSQ